MIILEGSATHTAGSAATYPGPSTETASTGRTVSGGELFSSYRQQFTSQFVSPMRNCREFAFSEPQSPKIWRHSFVFLLRKDAVFVPDARTCAELLAAGYGEKKLEFMADGGPTHVHKVLCGACTDLSTTGYELCCSGQSCTSGAKLLEAMEPPKKGYSVEFLRTQLSQAICYVRPIQRDLLKDRLLSESVSMT